MKISVIIPVYNAEKYLKECLHSVVNQTFEGFEIICINDGSTDASLKIINQYAKDYKNVVVINQKNLMTGVARKNAIACAKGDYLAFVDADDWVEEDYLQKLYNKLVEEKADACFCGYVWHMKNKTKIKKKPKIKMIRPFNYKQKIIYKSGQAKIIKKSFFNNVAFPESCCYNEDTCISMQICLQIPKIVLLNEALYHYRINASSTVQKQNAFVGKLKQLVNGYVAIENFVKNNEELDINLQFIRNFWFVDGLTGLIEENVND